VPSRTNDNPIRTARRLSLAALLLAGLGLFQPAQAATYTVTNLNDSGAWFIWAFHLMLLTNIAMQSGLAVPLRQIQPGPSAWRKIPIWLDIPKWPFKKLPLLPFLYSPQASELLLRDCETTESNDPGPRGQALRIA
jgi:hypothetical protein